MTNINISHTQQATEREIIEQIELLADSNEEIRNTALFELIQIGPPAIKPLINVIADTKKYGLEPWHALAIIGDPAVPYLINQIETQDKRMFYAAEVLDNMRTPSLVKPLVSMLARMLTKSGDVKIPSAVFDVMASLSYEFPESFIEILQFETNEEVWSVAFLLFFYGPQDLEKVLVPLLNSGDSGRESTIMKVLTMLVKSKNVPKDKLFYSYYDGERFYFRASGVGDFIKKMEKAQEKTREKLSVYILGDKSNENAIEVLKKYHGRRKLKLRVIAPNALFNHKNVLKVYDKILKLKK